MNSNTLLAHLIRHEVRAELAWLWEVKVPVLDPEVIRDQMIGRWILDDHDFGRAYEMVFAEVSAQLNTLCESSDVGKTIDDNPEFRPTHYVVQRNHRWCAVPFGELPADELERIEDFLLCVQGMCTRTESALKAEFRRRQPRGEPEREQQ